MIFSILITLSDALKVVGDAMVGIAANDADLTLKGVVLLAVAAQAAIELQTKMAVNVRFIIIVDS
ncbi:MAG: hypothetical protein MJK04_36810 [Psychrosphaera sp.]|nr:hypothetical protein [Psychrosphaera sp.]